jgi:hypothetical protein
MQRGENNTRKEGKEGKYYNKKEIYNAMYANCKEHKNGA